MNFVLNRLQHSESNQTYCINLATSSVMAAAVLILLACWSDSLDAVHKVVSSYYPCSDSFIRLMR